MNQLFNYLLHCVNVLGHQICPKPEKRTYQTPLRTAPLGSMTASPSSPHHTPLASPTPSFHFQRYEYHCVPTTRVPQDHSCPQRGGLVQGWESECCGVGGSLSKCRISIFSHFQSFKVSKIRISKFQGFKVSNVQRFEVSKTQNPLHVFDRY